MLRTASAMACFCLLAACGASRQAGPDAVLEAFVLAMEEDDFERAYALLSESQRSRISLEGFVDAARSNAGEVDDQARLLRRQLSDPVPVRASMAGPSGEAAVLLLEDGRWRLTEGAAFNVSLDSPQQAVRALRRALERRSFQALVRVLSREARAVLEDEAARIAEGLADEEALRFEITGNRARALYDDTHFIDLVREEGEWVVVDMD